TVNQTLTSIGVSPSSPTVNTLGSQQFSVMGLDQFGNTMTTQPVITWSVTGGGSINSSGLYTAPASTGTATVKATSGSVSGSDNVTITQTQTAQTSTQLPNFSYSMPSSNPALQPGMDTFTPPSGGTTTSGAPIIDASDSIGGPNNSITLTGAQFTSYTGSGAYSDTQFLVYGQTSSGNATLTNAQIQDTSVDGVTITIPSTEPANAMYLVWAQNNSGISTPIAVNRTQAWWLSNAGNTSPGQSVSVYGENLSNGASTSQSWVYLQPTAGGQGQWATVTSVNPYQVDFTVPTALANGTYQVWVNNGLGGNYSWSEASTLLTVQGSSSWNSALMVNVQNYGATGNGKTDDGPAILDAIGALQSGDTLYFPTGTYLVDGEQLILPSNVRVLGVGQNQSTIEFEGAVPNNGLGAFEIGVYSFNDQHNVEFDSLTLEYAGPETYSLNSGTSLVSEANGTNFTFNNVTILANDLQPIDWQGSNELTLENSTILGLDISVIGA
ncbi:MAG TPA: glycosyl hydrolase family 28-related protein, partial [Phycisphaerae bacterium]|nr:glycosyl hydrolase family 28-related protein [Phycisphaerae bacterium]